MKLTSVHDPERIHATFDEIDGLCIVISNPTAPCVATMFFYALIVFVGAFVCLAFFTSRVLAFAWNHNPDAFIPPAGIVVAMFTVTACAIGFAYSYNYELRRREVIQVDGFNLRLAWQGFLFLHRRTRVFSLKDVRNFRYAPSEYPPHSSAWKRSIAFDYLGSRVHFGLAVPEKEARRIIKTIKDRYKLVEDKDEALPVEGL